MQRTYSHAWIRILCALAAMALLAACGDSHTNFLTNEADLQTAISQLRSAIGARPRVLKIEVEADVVAIEAQDPKNPNHVDRWRYVNFVFGPVSTQRLMGPDPVELNLLNPDLEANLFDLSVVDFSATSKLESAALKRAHLQDAALISRMEIARQTFILPEPSSGDVRWSLHIESGRERAEIHANASGAITHADLGGTMRAQTLNLTNEPALVVDAAADFRAKVGALPVVTKVSIDPKTVAFKTVIRDTTFGKAESGPPSYSSFTWDLNGLIQRLGVVDIRSATKLNRAGFAGGPNSWEDGVMETTKKPSNKFSHEVRARAVRMVQEHRGDHASQWAAIASIAAKIGCSGETLRNWVRQAERDAGVRPGATTDERERIKALERENRELRQANEILRKASAYFAQAELDRRFKP